MSIEKIINDAWEIKDKIKPDSDKNLNQAINEVINDLDSGKFQELLKNKAMENGKLTNI